jgi:hypothetical protein
MEPLLRLLTVLFIGLLGGNFALPKVGRLSKERITFETACTWCFLFGLICICINGAFLLRLLSVLFKGQSVVGETI